MDKQPPASPTGSSGIAKTVQRGLDGATTVIAPSRWMLSQIEKLLWPAAAARRHLQRPQSADGSTPHADKEDIVLTVGRLWDPAKQVSLLTQYDCGWPVVIAGETQHPDEAYRGDASRIVCEGTAGAEGQADRLSRCGRCSRARRSTPRPRATSRSGSRWWRPRSRAAPSSPMTFRHSASCGERRRVYFQTNDAARPARHDRRYCARTKTARRQYAELAYQRARRHFTADRMVDEYLGEYETLTGQRTVGGMSGQASLPHLRAFLAFRLESRQRSLPARPGARAGAPGTRGALLRGARARGRCAT